MSTGQDIEEQNAHHAYGGPYTSRHPIPTVQKYREHRKDIEERQQLTEQAQEQPADDSKVRRAYDSAKAILQGREQPKGGHDPYPNANRHEQSSSSHNEHDGKAESKNEAAGREQETNGEQQSKQGKEQQNQSAAEANAATLDPRQKRKNMKHMKRDDGGREVTDPVTHLPVTIYDSTSKDLRSAPENEPAYGSVPRSMTGLSGASKDSKQYDAETDELQRIHDGTQKLFPPPSFDDTKAELRKTYQQAMTAGLGTVLGLALTSLIAIQAFGPRTPNRSWTSYVPFLCGLTVTIGGGLAAVLFFNGWIGKKIDDVWQDEVWDAAREEEQQSHNQEAILPESVAWLNSLLASVWPLINPELFTSVSDMLEDVMQASLPKVVRMVSVDDLGQGNEAIRILGIKWLPTGAASRSVDETGKFKSVKESQQNDRDATGEGEEEQTDDKDQSKNKEEEQEQQAIREGMEAEQGDFVNMEMAFAYRARSSGKSLKSKAKNAHLYLKFYLPGGVAVPVWVEMRGIIGKMRLRLQLTPDPPFFSLCTLTFLGQPKADLSCIPISKHALNLMDVPLISSFVQSSIDAALAEYVAPKSLTLDLKDMLVGDDFKKDTVSRGVVMIYLNKARDFKEGDGGIGPMKGSSDSYATVSWGKFGKPVASTRIIVSKQQPNWDEWAHILVSPEEINAGEKLRIQLWDSDKYTADDDLGRVEVDLKELMHSPKTKNQMCEREDRFAGEDADEEMPGTLTWKVGYFQKVEITQDQIEKQEVDSNIKSVEDLKKAASDSAENKMREARSHEKEIEQQKKEDFKEREDELVIAAPPPEEFPSGIFGIQIHNITGLQVQQLQKDDSGEGAEQEGEEGEDLPSSYATIILDQQQIYRTRTKPKNSKPFFNAGTERFVSDWKTTEVMISVRDDRERENDALLGMVYLPLKKVFEKRSQTMQSYPLMGGMGHGRIRVSMVWRSVELKLPKELLGWNLGTLEVKSPAKGGIDASRIKLRTNLGQAKMTHDGEWKAKHGRKSLFLPVRKRYSSALVVEFRKSTVGPDSTTGFAILWLQDIPDDEEKTITLPVWSGHKDLKIAETSAGYEGEKAGEIELTLKFWRGLSGYHKKYASKARGEGMRNVMECLDTVNDENEGGDDESDSDDSTREELQTHANQDSEDEDGKLNKVKDKFLGHNKADDGSRGAMAQIRDYKDHHKQLHRKHRGVMQWKGARTFDWMVGKMKAGGGKATGVFEHSEKTKEVETEV